MSSIAAGIKQGALHQARPGLAMRQHRHWPCCACEVPLCLILPTSTGVWRMRDRKPPCAC